MNFNNHNQCFPEVDRAAWFDIELAKMKIHHRQMPLLMELCELMRRLCLEKLREWLIILVPKMPIPTLARLLPAGPRGPRCLA